MNENQKYFVHLLKSHINNSIPSSKPDEVKWKDIFKLGELHNLTGMVCLAIKSMPIEQRPNKGMTYFNQALGQTIQSFEIKQECDELISCELNNAGIKHMFVKGSSIRSLYPVPAVRTSGDIDLIVEMDDFQNATKLLIDKGATVIQDNDIQYVLDYKGQEIELKNYLDHVDGIGKNKYTNNFNNAHIINEYTYELNDTYHLFYVIAHMLDHIKYGGAGLRQLLDIHVLITKYNIDFDYLFQLLDSIGLHKSGMSLIQLSSVLFDTKIPFNNEIDIDLYNLLTDIIINGGVFGFANGDNGTVRLAQTDNNKKLSPIKAFVGLFIVSKDYLYRTYKYANKHHILLPIAYFNRLFDAVFKRGKQNSKYIKSMFNNKESAIKISELNKELQI